MIAKIHSRFKPDFLSNFVYSLTSLVTLLGVTYFAFLQAMQKPCCDATVYLNYGTSLLNNSLLVPPSENQPSDLRTFVYPVFLAMMIRVAKLLVLEPIILITLSQTVIYILAVNFVTVKLKSDRTNIQRNIWIALMLNFFIWPYLGSTLTDSLYVSLFLFFFGICIDIFRNSKAEIQSVNSKTFFLTCCFSTLLVLRPVSIWITPIFVYFVYLLIKLKRKSFLFELPSFFLGFTAIFYQTYINLYLFSKLTPFPVVDLGSMQVNWGIRYLKYITWLGGGSPQGIYSSQNLIGEVPENLSVQWYFENPLLAMKLLFTKLVGAFDFDFLVPYPQNRPWYSFLTGTTSLLIFLYGSIIMTRYLFRKKSNWEQNFPRQLPFVMFFSWSAVTLVSAVELRFTLPLITLFIILIASEGIPNKVNLRRIAVCLPIFVLSLVLIFRVAFFVRGQATF